MVVSLPPGYFDLGQRRPVAHTSQHQIGTTPETLLQINFNRLGAVIYNAGSGTIYLGGGSGVSSTRGHILPSGASFSVTNPEEVWAVSDSSGPYLVSTFEEQLR